MIASSGFELYKPGLNELTLGDHSLLVPWEDDSIQLNVVVRDGISMAPFPVAVQEDTISFGYKHGQKFQIHDNLRPIGSPEQRGITEVLAGPISGFALHGCVESVGVWSAVGEGLKIVNKKGFDTFLALIFLEVYKQQNPNATIAEITGIFDKYPDL
ncbi:MAG: hypothetical protein ACHQT9_01800 [Candidatus Saccharimonadales bacterium]